MNPAATSPYAVPTPTGAIAAPRPPALVPNAPPASSMGDTVVIAPPAAPPAIGGFATTTAPRIDVPTAPPLDLLPPPPVTPGLDALPPPPAARRGALATDSSGAADSKPAPPKPSKAGVVLDAARTIKRLVGVVIIVGAVGVAGSMYLSGYRKATAIPAGVCIDRVPTFSDSQIKTMDCSSSDARYRVLFNDEATGSSYPGNISSLESRCDRQGGDAVPPSKGAWDHGDHLVLCLKAVARSRR